MQAQKVFTEYSTVDECNKHKDYQVMAESDARAEGLFNAQWIVPQLSIRINYNGTWSILIQLLIGLW